MKKILTFYLSISLTLIACKKSSIEQQGELKATELQGQLGFKGTVSLADESGKFFTDNSGMTVSVENSNPIISAVSDSRGNFVLPLDSKLPSFALVYNKQGFGTYKRYFTRDSVGNLYSWDLNNTKSLADGTFEEMSEKSSVVINSFNVAIIGDTLKLSLNISSIGDGQKYIQLLVQKNLSNISINTIDQNVFPWQFKYAVKNGDNIFNQCLKCSAKCNNWVSGDVIYFTAYGDSYYSNDYLDRSSNRFVFPNLNLSSQIQPVFVVIP